MKNPFRRISILEAEILDLKTTNDTLTGHLAELEQTVASLVRDDQQIATLRKIQTAVEYVASAEKHDRQANLKRHEF